MEQLTLDELKQLLISRAERLNVTPNSLRNDKTFLVPIREVIIEFEERQRNELKRELPF